MELVFAGCASLGWKRMVLVKDGITDSTFCNALEVQRNVSFKQFQGIDDGAVLGSSNGLRC